VTLAELQKRYPGAETFKFGDNAALSEELLALVISGAKRATCTAVRDYEDGKEALPVVGRRDIALHWDDTPAVVIETTEVTRRKYSEVDAAFVLAEGENDTLDGWRAHHRRYFERNGGWSEDMMLICERFKVIEVVE